MFEAFVQNMANLTKSGGRVVHMDGSTEINFCDPNVRKLLNIIIKINGEVSEGV